MAELENKRIFLLVTADPTLEKQLETVIVEHIQNATIFSAVDGTTALFKAENVPPHVVVIDYRISRLTAGELTEKLLDMKFRTAVIILSPDETEDRFMDHVVTGQVQFLSNSGTVSIFQHHITRALNWVAQEDTSIYHIKFLEPQEYLIREGDKSNCVYIVRSGELKAFKKDGANEVLLGTILPGEFVGEMAYINGEPRSASVLSTTDCELIEIPANNLDAVLFSKPAWSKALLKTLSRRLKNSIEEKLKE